MRHPLDGPDCDHMTIEEMRKQINIYVHTVQDKEKMKAICHTVFVYAAVPAFKRMIEEQKLIEAGRKPEKTKPGLHLIE